MIDEAIIEELEVEFRADEVSMEAGFDELARTPTPRGVATVNVDETLKFLDDPNEVFVEEFDAALLSILDDNIETLTNA